jgi:hypothetical protein
MCMAYCTRISPWYCGDCLLVGSRGAGELLQKTQQRYIELLKCSTSLRFWILGVSLYENESCGQSASRYFNTTCTQAV